jgi:hypothetical protein
LTIVFNTNFIELDNCGIHKRLRVGNSPLFEEIDLVPDPLSPNLRLADTLVGSEDVLDFLGFRKYTRAGGSKSKEVGQLDVNGRNVKVDDGRVKL